MDLFPHNQYAFESAVQLFKSENRVCIIHPTGTGKSLIIAEFINRNPSKRHLLLAPGTHIFNEICKHVKVSGMAFSTYIGLKLKKTFFLPDSFDYVYLDEFHRLGADVWGGTVESLLKRNPKAKILGTSATHIRYLDDNRNMATEIFKDHIASQMSLNSAIVSGILPAPKYISALYSIQKEFEQLKGRIWHSKFEDKEALIRDLHSKVIDWEKSSGLDLIIKKHLNVKRRRVIVFCKDWGHLKYAQKVLNPVFQEIYGRFESLSLYASQKEKENEKALTLFRGKLNQAMILYTIDKVNEGLHSEKCNTVILLRDTISPIVFYQQIGRAFSIRTTNRPMIIDLVNNFKNIALGSFKEDLERESNSFVQRNQMTMEEMERAKIEFIDEIQDVRQFFSAIDDKIDIWNIFYCKAKAYFKDHGHLYVPFKNKELSDWVCSQRRAYRLGQIRKEQIELLNNIGMVFVPTIQGRWMRIFFKLENWVNENGRLPTRSEAPPLEQWISKQRVFFKLGKLSEEQANMVKRFVPLEGNRIRLQVRARVDRLIKHFKEGDLDTASDKIRKDLRCIIDLHRYKGVLSDNEVTDLRKGHVPFEITMNDLAWLENVKKAIKWYVQQKKFPTRREDSMLQGFLKKEKTYIDQQHPYEKFIAIDKEASRLLARLQKILLKMRQQT